jgi:hypothetical protein
MCTDPAERERRNRQMWLAQLALARMTARMMGLMLVGTGALALLSGATGHDGLSRLFTRGAVSLNDAVPGAAMVAIGLLLLRVAGRAPLLDQARAMRRWDSRRWISLALGGTGVLVGLAVSVIHPLLPLWMHYGLSGVATLIIIAGSLLWPKQQDRPA